MSSAMAIDVATLLDLVSTTMFDESEWVDIVCKVIQWVQQARKNAQRSPAPASHPMRKQCLGILRSKKFTLYDLPLRMVINDVGESIDWNIGSEEFVQLSACESTNAGGALIQTLLDAQCAKLIYTWNLHGEFNIARAPKGRIKHSQLAKGMPVYAAGELIFKPSEDHHRRHPGWILVEINNASGHYRPTDCTILVHVRACLSLLCGSNVVPDTTLCVDALHT